jgi:DNA-binding transcriptional LysR family regulator
MRALVTLKETGGITQCAKRLGVTQPVISRKLQVFLDPDACGTVLLKRVDGRLAFTESGEAVLPAMREVVRGYDRVLHFMAGRVAAPQSLKIGTGGFAAEFYLPEVIQRAMKDNEEQQIETHVCRGRERILGTANGAFDMSIVTHDEGQIRTTLQGIQASESALAVTRLGKHPFCLIARRGTRHSNELSRIPVGRVVTISALTEWELIGPDANSGIRRQLEERMGGKQLYFIAEGGGWAAARRFAEVGLGIAIMPIGALISSDRRTFVVRKLASEFSIQFLLINRPGSLGTHGSEIKNLIAKVFSEKKKEVAKLQKQLA